MRHIKEKALFYTEEIPDNDKIINGVMKSIEESLLLRTKIKTILFGCITLGSVWFGISIFYFTHEHAKSSGFYAYIDLIRLDWSLSLENWKVLSISVIESIPIVNLMFILTTILIFTISIKMTEKHLWSYIWRSNRLDLVN